MKSIYLNFLRQYNKARCHSKPVIPIFIKLYEHVDNIELSKEQFFFRWKLTLEWNQLLQLVFRISFFFRFFDELKEERW